ncbi:MAG: BrnT family toxin [Coriobacteriia bacterium]|nr:BrnT family toxin [Coriobacteriia bacterium]
MERKFVFDEAKSAVNKAKHGIDFVEAQAIWRDDRPLQIAGRTEAEDRFIVIGRIEGRHWSAVVTYRGDCVRLISVRRSRKQEVEAYEGE